MARKKAFSSILGTTLALSAGLTLGLALGLASPAAAAPKGKKGKKSEEKAPEAEAAGESESVDSLMDKATEKPAEEKSEAKGKKAKGKKKKGEEEPAEEEEPAAEAAPAEEVVEPDAWERPPMEEEKPQGEEAKTTEPPKLVNGDGKPILAGILAGWGFKTDGRTAGLGADPYGLALGAHGGYTLDFQLYVGAYFVYYLGMTETGSSGRIATGERSTHSNYIMFGLEGGYDIPVVGIILRPSLQIGMAIGVTDRTGLSESVSDLVFGPGIALVVPLDDLLFLGGDARGQIVTGDGVSGFLVAATFGMRFE